MTYLARWDLSKTFRVVNGEKFSFLIWAVEEAEMQRQKEDWPRSRGLQMIWVDVIASQADIAQCTSTCLGPPAAPRPSLSAQPLLLFVLLQTFRSHRLQEAFPGLFCRRDHILPLSIACYYPNVSAWFMISIMHLFLKQTGNAMNQRINN